MDTRSPDSSVSAHDWPWMNTSLSPDERAALLLAQMTLEEKVGMVHGELPAPYGFYNAPISRLGIPALTMADGPTGIRVCRQDVNEGKATALPAPIGLAATWDVAAAEQDILDAGATLLREYSDIGAILLECTNMVPYARALRDRFGLPVYDIYSFMTWFHAGLAPRDFGHPGSGVRSWRER